MYYITVVLVLRSTFDAFDVEKKGYIETDMIGTILDMLGTQLVGEELQVLLYCCYLFGKLQTC